MPRKRVPPEHLTADEVWRRLEAEPGFNEEMEQGRWYITNGQGIPFRDVRRESTEAGGPVYRWPS